MAGGQRLPQLLTADLLPFAVLSLEHQESHLASGPELAQRHATRSAGEDSVAVEVYGIVVSSVAVEGVLQSIECGWTQDINLHTGSQGPQSLQNRTRHCAQGNIGLSIWSGNHQQDTERAVGLCIQ